MSGEQFGFGRLAAAFANTSPCAAAPAWQIRLHEGLLQVPAGEATLADLVPRKRRMSGWSAFKTPLSHAAREALAKMIRAKSAGFGGRSGGHSDIRLRVRRQESLCAGSKLWIAGGPHGKTPEVSVRLCCPR